MLRSFWRRRGLLSGTMNCLCSGEVPSQGTASTVPGVPGATVRLDKDGFMDIREPMVVEERARPDTSGMDGTEDAWRFWQSASSQQGNELSKRLRELEEMEEMEEMKQEAVDGGNSKSSVDEMLELDQIMGHYEDLAPTAASEHEGWCMDLILWLVVPLGSPNDGLSEAVIESCWKVNWFMGWFVVTSHPSLGKSNHSYSILGSRRTNIEY